GRSESAQDAFLPASQDHAGAFHKCVRQPPGRGSAAARREAVFRPGTRLSAHGRGGQDRRKIRTAAGQDPAEHFPASGRRHGYAGRSRARSGLLAGCVERRSPGGAPRFTRGSSRLSVSGRLGCRQTRGHSARRPQRYPVPSQFRSATKLSEYAAAAAPARISPGAGYFRDGFQRVPHGFLRSRKTGRIAAELGQWSVASGSSRACRIRRALCAVPLSQGLEDLDSVYDATGVDKPKWLFLFFLFSLPAWSAAMRCRDGWNGSRRNISRGASAGTNWMRSTIPPSRPRSKTRRSPVWTSSPTASLAATTWWIISWS